MQFGKVIDKYVTAMAKSSRSNVRKLEDIYQIENISMLVAVRVRPEGLLLIRLQLPWLFSAEIIVQITEVKTYRCWKRIEITINLMQSERNDIKQDSITKIASKYQESNMEREPNDKIDISCLILC